jgi:hypothetical protein
LTDVLTVQQMTFLAAPPWRHRNGYCCIQGMANALFAFDDLASAQRAAERAAARLPPEAVAVHTKDTGRSESLLDQADETVISGGLLRNMYDLFQGIFEWGESPHDAAAYEETVRKGGAVLSVDANSEDQRVAVDRALHDTGFQRRTDWG